MNNLGKALLSAMTLAFGAMAFAQPVIDGTLDNVYGSAIATQTQVTGFGQNTVGAVDNANGSQLDAAYGMMTSTTLYLMFTGNLQTNGNTLDLWFDTGATGQNTLSGMGTVTMDNWSGSTLSTGFNASTGLTINGSSNGTAYAFYANMDTLTGSTWSDTYLGTNGYGATGNGTLSGGTNPNNVAIAINNSNIGLSINASDKTGMEYAIPLAALGMTTAGPVKIIAAINGNGDNYLSNQFLSGLNTASNLGSINGGANTVNLSSDGNPMFSVSPQAVPAPASIAFLGLGLVGLAFRRRTR